MEKLKIRFDIVIAVFIFILIIIGIFGKNYTTSSQDSTQGVGVTQQQTAETVSYHGVEGKDALTLLKEHASVEQVSSGLVTVINGRKADDKAHEYWAFYVNGKLAEKGPKEYRTHSADLIEWKIERY